MPATWGNRTLACFSALGILPLALLAGCGKGTAAPASLPTASLPAVTLKSISIGPSSANIASGGTQQFSAMGTFSDNSMRDITSAASVSWQSDNVTVATISVIGLATGRSQGTATISARDNVTGIASNVAILTVGPPTLASIRVTPANQTIQTGQNLQFTATGSFSDGSIQNLTTAVNWTSSNMAAAIVSNAAGSQGLATASANMAGTTVITATDPATMIKGTTNLSTTSLTSIAITAVNSSVSVGASDQLFATGTFNNGVTMDISRSVIWTPGCTPAIAATIDNTGLATGQAIGTCNVTAANSTGNITSPVFVLTVTSVQLCANRTAVSYHGIQAVGGDRFEACISRADSSFSLLDQSAKAVANQGNFTSDATYSNLLNLTASTPVAGTGAAVEMPSTVLLVNPGTMKTRSASPLPDPIMTGFLQTGFCPSAGSTFQFVTLPPANWVSSLAAYGTVTLTSSTVTINRLALNGAALGSETDPFSCDPNTSLLTFTNATGTAHMAVSPDGLFGDSGANAMVGLPQATNSVSFAVGDIYLGIIYEPHTATPARTIGFLATSSASLSGFDPITSGHPGNGITINLGSESSFGLFTGGTLVEGLATDTNFVVIADILNGKKVLYGITFDTQRNTPVEISLLQQ